MEHNISQSSVPCWLVSIKLCVNCKKELRQHGFAWFSKINDYLLKRVDEDILDMPKSRISLYKPKCKPFILSEPHLPKMKHTTITSSSSSTDSNKHNCRALVVFPPFFLSVNLLSTLVPLPAARHKQTQADELAELKLIACTAQLSEAVWGKRLWAETMAEIPYIMALQLWYSNC